eukprot:1683602-Rhodomonas_salina.2
MAPSSQAACSHERSTQPRASGTLPQHLRSNIQHKALAHTRHIRTHLDNFVMSSVRRNEQGGVSAGVLCVLARAVLDAVVHHQPAPRPALAARLQQILLEHPLPSPSRSVSTNEAAQHRQNQL